MILVLFMVSLVLRDFQVIASNTASNAAKVRVIDAVCVLSFYNNR